MIRSYDRVNTRVISFRQGDHICLLYRDYQEQMKVAAPFVEIGLLRGERCLCVITSVPMELMRDFLDSKGMNPDREVSRGALLLATPQEAYLRNGRFNRQDMVKFLDDSNARRDLHGLHAVQRNGRPHLVCG